MKKINSPAPQGIIGGRVFSGSTPEPPEIPTIIYKKKMALGMSIKA